MYYYIIHMRIYNQHNVAVLNCVCVCWYVYIWAIYVYIVCFDVFVLCGGSMSTSFAFMKCTMKYFDTFHLQYTSQEAHVHLCLCCLFSLAWCFLMLATVTPPWGLADTVIALSQSNPSNRAQYQSCKHGVKSVRIWILSKITCWKQLLRRMLNKTVRTV